MNIDNGVLFFSIIALFVVYFILIKCTNKNSKDRSFVEKENNEEIVILVKELIKDLIEEDESITEKKINKKVALEKSSIKEDKIKFNENKRILLRLKKDNPNYPEFLFETGLLYEKIYKDYFRAACYCYLATLIDSSNQEYEKNYIRLCKLVGKHNGFEWEYQITLVKTIYDVEDVVNNLLNANKVKSINKKDKKKAIKKPIVVQTTYKKTKSSSKFNDFNTESYLHSLGYKVGKTGLSEYKRRQLLDKVLKKGQLSKYDIIETLERNISMFGHRIDRQKAVSDWKIDLKYIKDNY